MRKTQNPTVFNKVMRFINSNEVTKDYEGLK